MPEKFCKQFSESEIEDIRKTFKEQPTYKNEEFEGGYIFSSDISAILKAMKLETTSDQAQMYKTYWDQHYGGKVPMDKLLDIVRVFHDTAESAAKTAEAYDKDGDGYIDAEEFAEHQKQSAIHDPRLKAHSYEEFLEAADVNKDGKVSIEEFKNWINACLEK